MVRTRRQGVAFTVVVTVLVALGALPMLLILALSGAPGTLLLATVLAALPVGPLVGCYLWLDRYEPEPKSLRALGLLWGGFVATAGALLVQGIGGLVVGDNEENVGGLLGGFGGGGGAGKYCPDNPCDGE